MEDIEFWREIVDPQRGVKARKRMDEIDRLLQARIKVALERGETKKTGMLGTYSHPSGNPTARSRSLRLPARGSKVQEPLTLRKASQARHPIEPSETIPERHPSWNAQPGSRLLHGRCADSTRSAC